MHHAIPAAWDVTTPAALLDARLAARRRARCARAVGDLLDDPSVGARRRAGPHRRRGLHRRRAPALRRATPACRGPTTPHLALWHAISLLREFRGDGHIACLVEAGLDGIDALVVHAASGEVPRAALQTSRQLGRRRVGGVRRRASPPAGLVDGDGAFTEAGAALRQHIEDRTDALALAPWAALGEDGCDELRSLVRPLSKAIVGERHLRASAVQRTTEV